MKILLLLCVPCVILAQSVGTTAYNAFHGSQPGSCAVGDTWDDTSQAAGANWKICTTAGTPGTWSVQGGGPSVAQTRRVCDIAVGDTSGGALVNAQLGPQSRVCFIPAAATVVEVDVNADAGTPNVQVARNHAGTIVNLLTSALATAGSGGIACSLPTIGTGLNGVTSCSGTLTVTSLGQGDYLELVSGTAGGTAKFFVVHIIYTIN